MAESLVERRIREAQEQGLFDDLPGHGQPLPDIDLADESWWLRRKLEAEGLTAQEIARALAPRGRRRPSS